jgi:hypothetical protein
VVGTAIAIIILIPPILIFLFINLLLLPLHLVFLPFYILCLPLVIGASLAAILAYANLPSRLMWFPQA